MVRCVFIIFLEIVLVIRADCHSVYCVNEGFVLVTLCMWGKIRFN